jgi:hypothetical protein
MVITCAVNNLTVRACHTASDHGHCAADLEDGAVNMDFCSYEGESGERNRVSFRREK